MKLITIALVGASKRADATVVEDAVVTKYEMNGKELNAAKVEQGVKDGIYILLDDTTSAAPVPTKAAVAAGEFLEQKKPTTPAAPSTTSVAPPPPPPTTSAAPVVPTPAPSSGGGSGATGLDADFPSGTIVPLRLRPHRCRVAQPRRLDRSPDDPQLQPW
jgi:hypothetical protein